VKKSFNLFDVFLILLVILALSTVYFKFFHPLEFSHRIMREGVPRYVEIDIILSDDLAYMKDEISVGDGRDDVYGQVEWEILGLEEKNIAGEKRTILKTKIRALERFSGIVKHGKYTLVKGALIHLVNKTVLIGGRILDVRFPETNVLI